MGFKYSFISASITLIDYMPPKHISLLAFSADDYRVFVGDLGHEVNDDMLFRSFVGFPSLLKARVIRDKITKKSRGYGFVSFKDGQDYLRAMREMNGVLSLLSPVIYELFNIHD